MNQLSIDAPSPVLIIVIDEMHRHPRDAIRPNGMSPSYLIKNHPDCQTAARTYSYLFTVAHVTETDLKLVSTRAGVGVEEEGRVVGEIFELNLVIERHGVIDFAMQRLYFVTGSESGFSGYQIQELLLWYYCIITLKRSFYSTRIFLWTPHLSTYGTLSILIPDDPDHTPTLLLGYFHTSYDIHISKLNNHT